MILILSAFIISLFSFYVSGMEVDISNSHTRSEIQLTSQENSRIVIKALYAHIPNLEQFSDKQLEAFRDKDGLTLLHRAVQSNLGIAKDLALRCPQLLVQLSPSGYMPIHCAAENGHTELVAELLTIDESLVNAQSFRKFTPLMLAAMNGHADIIQICLKYKPDLTMRNDVWKTTACEVAQKFSHPKIAQLLKKYENSQQL